MPLLYGSDVTLESPDPMSKYNSANQKSSDLQQVAAAQKNSRISMLLQNCKQDATDQSRQVPKLNLQSVASIRAEASKFILDEKQHQQQQQQFDNKYQIHVSPDAITDDIYDFDTRKSQSHYKQEADSCKYPMCNDSLALESTPPLQKMSDDEESQLTSRVHAARHKSIRIVEKNMTRRSLSPSLNTLERQLQQKDSSISSPQMMPCSRSLDTLHPHTPNSEEESVRNAFKPTPPSRPQGIRVTFTRKSPQPPSTASPKFQSQGNVMATPPGANRENLEANIRHARGRRYTNPVSPVVEETKEDINSPLANISTRPMPSRPTSNSHRRRPQPSSPTQPTTVQIEYSIKSPERLKKSLSEATSVSVSPLRPTDIPHPSPKRKKGDRVVSVSGLSKELLVSLITAAGKKRRRRNKNQPAFSIQLEQIPEDNFIDLSFPSWIAIATTSTSQQGHMGKKLPVEKSAERLFAESEYLEWLKSQVVVKQLNDQDTSNIETDSGSNKIDFLMRSIQNQDNEQFKSLLNENKNLIYCRDQNGNTALVAATLFGWKRGIKNLIKRGADLDAQNRFGNTSLHYASAIEDHHEIKRYLIRKQASTTIRNERGVCSCDSIQ
jgi:hypothetical protein